MLLVKQSLRRLRFKITQGIKKKKLKQKLKKSFRKSKILIDNLLDNLTLKTKRLLVRETHHLLQVGIVMVVLVVLISGSLTSASSQTALAKISQQKPYGDSRALATLASATEMIPVIDLEESSRAKADSYFQSTEDGYLIKPSLTTIFQPDQGRTKIITYKVQGGDTLIGIAKKFNITTSTIKWANGIKNIHKIKPGQKLIILPVSGVLHKVKKGDTLAAIAEKYNAKVSKIISYNKLKSQTLKVGQKLIIPGGRIKEKPKPRPSSSSIASNSSPSATSNYSYYRYGNDSQGGWVIGRFWNYGSRFPGGWCTSWVSLKRYIPWLGNARDWPANAQAMGYRIGYTPRVGAVYCEPWLTWWGHVSYVERVYTNGSFLISEGNYYGYGGYGIASYRLISPGAGGVFIY